MWCRNQTVYRAAAVCSPEKLWHFSNFDICHSEINNQVCVDIHDLTCSLQKLAILLEYMRFSQALSQHYILQFIDVIIVRLPDSRIHRGILQKKQIIIEKFFNKSVNRCMPRIRLRPAEKESWSITQICTAGKGLLRPWGWNGCRNAEAGKRLVRKD